MKEERVQIGHVRGHGEAGQLICAGDKADDYETAKLLIEYEADYRLFVGALGLPIYAMGMSKKMRQLIPDRV